MPVMTREHLMAVISRAYGPDLAQSLADRLPERVDLDDPADRELLGRLGLTRDRLISRLGGEI